MLGWTHLPLAKSMIRVQCSNCAELLRVGPGLAGPLVACPGATVLVCFVGLSFVWPLLSLLPWLAGMQEEKRVGSRIVL